MGLLVDIRKYNIDNVINDLVDASKIKKNWFGKTTDKYWDYLTETTKSIKIDLHSHIVSDFFVFLIDSKKFKELLSSYTKALSENRNSFVTLIISDDKEFILNEINKPDFVSDFERYCKDLNGEYYEYNFDQLTENVQAIRSVLDEVDDNSGLIINIG
jgi:hypothetical protein